MELPLGFKFNPTDEKLISFLDEKVKRGEKPSHPFLGECDMYGDLEPWEIWNKYGGGQSWLKEGDDLYFFAKLKKLSANGSRVSRRVGSGTWSGSNCRKLGDVMAKKRQFQYKNSKRSNRKHGAWIMYEYSLLHNNNAPGDQDVLCRLRKKS